MRATGLTTEYETDPVGLATTRPRFSWRLESDDPSTEIQLAYEIEVASGGHVIWKTAMVQSAAQVLVPYAGQRLTSRQQCTWRVRVWAGEPGSEPTMPGPWSEPASFELALLRIEDWASTAWIGSPHELAQPPTPRLRRRRQNTDRPSPLLRKEFEVEQGDDIAEARLYCSALGIYDVEINGTSVSDDRLRPGFTAYDLSLIHI